MKNTSLYIILLLVFACQQQTNENAIASKDVQEDIAFLVAELSQKSSYVDLNGYDYRKDIEVFLQRANKAPLDTTDLGLFLTQTIGKIGDRHASVRGYDLADTLFLPYAVAPYGNEVVLLIPGTDQASYELAYPNYPLLKVIDGVPIKAFLSSILPEEIMAPQSAYHTRATRALRDIQLAYQLQGKEVPNPLPITLTDLTGSVDTSLQIELVTRKKRRINWDEKFYRKYFFLVEEDEDYNKANIYTQLFTNTDNIAYIHLPKMVKEDEAPNLYAALDSFMQHPDTKRTEALIIDVRNNSGGGRGLIMKMASYVIHPDSIHVVNVAQQRAELPLNEDWKRQLHNRYLFAYDELNAAEQKAVTTFNASFRPQYTLDTTKYSEAYYCVLNGKKISRADHYYDRPVYVLANERSFSAASVLTGMFKGLPQVTIAGMNTDGSSGNSESFRLPNTDLKVKVSTLVSFQKDGRLFDGFGTAPDVVIERDLDQILWKRDSQLERLREIIKASK
ncbi:MAG: S41 family peptidase [Bacteroidota bacterium]